MDNKVVAILEKKHLGNPKIFYRVCFGPRHYLICEEALLLPSDVQDYHPINGPQYLSLFPYLEKRDYKLRHDALLQAKKTNKCIEIPIKYSINSYVKMNKKTAAMHNAVGRIVRIEVRYLINGTYIKEEDLPNESGGGCFIL